MLASINFIFLLSLGFLSWTILCYIQQIEQFNTLNKKISQEVPKKEIPIMAESISPPIMKPNISNYNNFNVCLNFLCIAVCFYALVKITHLTEAYLAKCIRPKMYIPTIHNAYIETPTAVNALQDQQENLKRKLDKLEKQNQDMNSKLKSVVEHQPPPITAAVEEQVRNVFITNKHIHLNRQVYVTQTGTLNMEFEKQKTPQPSIWEKYLALNKSTTPHLSNDKYSTHRAVVISAEELNNIKGIF